MGMRNNETEFMEIDLPREPIHSVKDFFIHISTITVGILIALGLEQGIVAYHHRQLANEARANIVNELRDNKRELDGELKGAAKLNQQYRQALDMIGQFIIHKPPQKASMTLGYQTAELSSTSWSTAQSTGALSFMGYQEVKSFSGAYILQEEVQHQQEQLFQTYELALSGVANGGPGNMSAQELQNGKQEVKRTMAGLFVLEQLEAQLSRRYREILSKYAPK